MEPVEKKLRKQRPNVTIKEYLGRCNDEITLEKYLDLEWLRVKDRFKFRNPNWIELLQQQAMKCFYCETDLRIIQQLVLHGILNLRKRGSDGFSGLHFELDHRNSDKNDNSATNLVAACYFCNNDKSDTISCKIFKEYFGPQKHKALISLFEDSSLTVTNYRHNLKCLVLD